MRIRLRFVHESVDRHGNVRLYFWRRPGRKVRIREPIGSPAFSAKYHELLAGGAAATKPDGHLTKGTFRWLVALHCASVAFKSLDATTQRIRRQTLEHCCREIVAPDRQETFADFPLDRITTKALRVLRDRKAGLPQAANGRVKALRAIFAWAMTDEHVRTNPARELERIKSKAIGATAWAPSDVARYEERHPIGSKARLALAILLYTGMRRSDVVQFGPQHVKDGWISKPQHKGRKRHPQRIEIPMLPALAEVIEASSTGASTFLVTEYGQPFSIAGFGNWLRERCNEAGLKGLSAHGMRKAGATVLAEKGASAHQLMAIFGWRSLADAELYTRAADRKRLAREGMQLMETSRGD